MEWAQRMGASIGVKAPRWYHCCMAVLVHGIDAIDIARIGKMLAEHGEAFVQRCFTACERQYAEQSQGLRVQRYAARFACKEAVMKALGTGWTQGISWQDISIGRVASGQPTVTVQGRCGQVADQLGIHCWLVSLTHTPTLAIASVIGTGG
jgi:holo-[acyl-carrier protein] synthase